MVVKDFLPLSDVRNTTEKEVPSKPTIAELTTVDEPGRPTPATFLEDSSEKQTKKRVKKEKAKKEQVTTEKNAILIITEKPQAAQKIASALGNPRKYSNPGGASFFELDRDGKKVLVASAVGHLYNLEYVKGQKGWPIFNLEWRPSYERKNSAFTQKYFEILKNLAKRANSFIVATDFDNEGEVIGWNVLRFICKQKNAKRMKFSTLTAPELEKAYENPLPELAWQNAYAGEARHYIDWLYGINISRALMSAIKTTDSFKILSMGRVQGPALKIIVDREKEIANFKPEPYWQIFAHVGETILKHPKDIFDKSELDKFDNIKSGEAETKIKEELVPPPTPFDLTTLQREAYRLYKLSPSETLKIAQKLYLDGIISYPRTSSQKIPKEIEPKKILKKLEKKFPEVKQATRETPIEGSKSDPAHPSIYPTGEIAKLKEAEEKLYNIIAKRFIAAFSPDALTSNKRIVLKANGFDFTASGLVVINPGWTKTYPIEFEEIKLPDLNGKVKIDKIEKTEKETQPPKRYSPTSLVTILERKNLGTKATRSAIVDTLFARGYLDGTSIKATPLGMKLIESMEKYSPIIIDENLTRQLEEEMEEIQNSTSDFQKMEDKVIEKVKRVIEDISKEFKVHEKEIGKDLQTCIVETRKIQYEANILSPCQTCKKGNLRILYSKKSRRYFVCCTAYPDCKQTYSLPPNALIKKSDKVCESDGFPKLLAIRKGRRPWEFCFNPECKIEKAKRDAWETKQQDKLDKEEANKDNKIESDEEEA